MKQRIVLKIISSILLTATASFIAFDVSTASHPEPVVIQGEVKGEKKNTKLYESKVITKIKTKTKYITVEVPRKPEVELADEDKVLLAKIVHAEAGDQDQIGKRLIVDVVLNRMESKDFPDTISGVIYQKNQFTNPNKGYEESDMEAVEAELMERLDRGVLWFRTNHFHSYGEELYQHGDHYFSGVKFD